jgi:hypothetical protein
MFVYKWSLCSHPTVGRSRTIDNERDAACPANATRNTNKKKNERKEKRM